MAPILPRDRDIVKGRLGGAAGAAGGAPAASLTPRAGAC